MTKNCGYHLVDISPLIFYFTAWVLLERQTL